MEELATFLQAHPDIQFVDVLLPDLCNVIRGKRLPRADLDKFYQEGFQVPSSIMLLDVTGDKGAVDVITGEVVASQQPTTRIQDAELDISPDRTW